MGADRRRQLPTVQEKAPSQEPFLVPGAGVFSNLLMEGIERLWEVHEMLPDLKSHGMAFVTDSPVRV